MDIDIIERAAKIGGYQTQFKGYPYFDQLWDALVQRQVDVIASNVWVTQQKIQDNILFTLPYYVDGGIAAGYREGEFGGCPPVNVESLTGKQIGIIQGELPFYKMYIPAQYLEGARTYDNLEGLIKKGLVQRQVDVSLSQLSDSKDSIRFSLLIPMQAAFATLTQDVKKNLNKGLFQMWTDGSLYAIKSKYLDPPVSEVLPCEVQQYARQMS